MSAQHAESIAFDRLVAAAVADAAVAILLTAAGVFIPVSIVLAVVVGLVLLRA